MTRPADQTDDRREGPRNLGGEVPGHVCPFGCGILIKKREGAIWSVARQHATAQDIPADEGEKPLARQVGADDTDRERRGRGARIAEGDANMVLVTHYITWSGRGCVDRDRAGRG